ncbi:MAG: leucyl aminopeptidase family protein, partial [Proteobacteria bacterium]|nr:leucyl aminopeptidase family protein [Pseudomonadota bacterium]
MKTSQALAQLVCRKAAFAERADVSPDQGLHALILLPAGSTLPKSVPARTQLLAVLKRRHMKFAELAKTPLTLDLNDGSRYAYVMVDLSQPRFAQLSALRKATMLLLEETPRTAHVVVCESDGQVRLQLAREALYVLWLNGAPLPVSKKKPVKPLKQIVLHSCPRGYGDFHPADFAAIVALAEANTLARELTALPPNQLTPANYRKRVRSMAQEHGWRIKEYAYQRLRKLGAGAFCAVAQG